MVKVSTLVWPAARYSTSESAAVELQVSSPPAPLPVVSVLEHRRQAAQRAADGGPVGDTLRCDVGEVDVGEAIVPLSVSVASRRQPASVTAPVSVGRRHRSSDRRWCR